MSSRIDPLAKILTITDAAAQAEADRRYWRERSPEERLAAVERLRLESGKFLYDYPSRLRRLLAFARDSSG